MQTERQIKEIITEAKMDLLTILPDLKTAIDNNEYADVIEYATAMIVAACSINAAEGILQG